MNQSRRPGARLTAALLIVVARTVSAGIITEVVDITGPGLGVVLGLPLNIPTPAPNNDNPSGRSANQLNDVSKRFDRFGEIDIVFRVNDSQGTTEYSVTELVRNNTLVTWFDYHFILGFGTGAGFVPSNELDFLDFDQPYPPSPPPTSTVFQRRDQPGRPDTIRWSGGTVPRGEAVGFVLSFDVPDVTEQIPESARITSGGELVGYRFTLRQIPTVPEPATYLLCGAVLIFLGHRAIFRRKG